MKIPIPNKDERGNVLRLTNFQERSIHDVLRVFGNGALIGRGSARGALLADTMGAGKTVVAIAVANSVPTFRRILVICMAPAVENVWVEHIRRWQTCDLRITPVHAENTYDIGTIPSGWVIINYALLKKHHAGLRAKDWDLIIPDEGQALKTWNSVRTNGREQAQYSTVVLAAVPTENRGVRVASRLDRGLSIEAAAGRTGRGDTHWWHQAA
jgi:hypothetical protein